MFIPLTLSSMAVHEFIFHKEKLKKSYITANDELALNPICGILIDQDGSVFEIAWSGEKIHFRPIPIKSGLVYVRSTKVGIEDALTTSICLLPTLQEAVEHTYRNFDTLLTDLVYTTIDHLIDCAKFDKDLSGIPDRMKRMQARKRKTFKQIIAMTPLK